MRKSGIISRGLSALLIGAGTFFGGCNEPQPNYQGNTQNQSQSRSSDDAGRAGLTALQILLGLYGVADNGTLQQRNAAGFASNFIGEEKRNEAISNSGTNVYVNNGQQGQVYLQDCSSKINNVTVYTIGDTNGINMLKVDSRISTSNCKNRSLIVNYYFYNERGDKLISGTERYAASDGHLSTRSCVFAPIENDTSFDVSTFMPISDILSASGGITKFKVDLQVCDGTTNLERHLCSSGLVNVSW